MLGEPFGGKNPPGLSASTANGLYAGSIRLFKTDGTSTSYSTLALAKAAASSGETIGVFPGTYSATDNILKNGVNWFFYPGSEVTFTGIAGHHLFDDGTNGANGACTSIVGGYGKFTNTDTSRDGLTNNASNLFNITNSSSRINGWLNESSWFAGNAVRTTNGIVRVKARKLACNNYAALFVSGGELHGNSDTISCLLYDGINVYGGSGFFRFNDITCGDGGNPIEYLGGYLYVDGDYISSTDSPCVNISAANGTAGSMRVNVKRAVSSASNIIYSDTGIGKTCAINIGDSSAGGATVFLDSADGTYDIDVQNGTSVMGNLVAGTVSNISGKYTVTDSGEDGFTVVSGFANFRNGIVTTQISRKDFVQSDGTLTVYSDFIYNPAKTTGIITDTTNKRAGPTRVDLSGVTLTNKTLYSHSGSVGTSTLPAGVANAWIGIKHAGTVGTLTVNRAGSDTIFDATASGTSTTIVLGQYKEFSWDGTQWNVI